MVNHRDLAGNAEEEEVFGFCTVNQLQHTRYHGNGAMHE